MSAPAGPTTRPRHRRYVVTSIVLAVLLVAAIVLAYLVTRPPSFAPVSVPSVSIA